MIKELEEKIKKTGFKCRMCAECCSGGNNEVMVSADEIEIIEEKTGLKFNEIAEPYPEWIDADDEKRYTFGWVLKRGDDGNCIFLENKRCRIYDDRPNICRTYPFMIDNNNELLTFECDGLDPNFICLDAKTIAQDLIKRKNDEDKEFKETEMQYQKHSIGKGSTVIDSRGLHKYP